MIDQSYYFASIHLGKFLLLLSIFSYHGALRVFLFFPAFVWRCREVRSVLSFFERCLVEAETIFILGLVFLQILSGLLTDQFIDVIFFECLEVGLAGVGAA